VPVLAARAPVRFYTSAAVRAVDTGQIIATDLGVDLITLPGLGEVDLGSAEGATDPATRAETARVLHAWLVRGELTARVADGETGHQVLARITAALGTIAADNPGRTVALVGHVASLTAGLAATCRLGASLWGTPLPPATPSSSSDGARPGTAPNGHQRTAKNRPISGTTGPFRAAGPGWSIGRCGERVGVDAAVVLGEDRAGVAGSVGHRAPADLAAYDRQLGHGHRVTGGAGVRHLHR
jgi:broad specificity phosphatase PhoE